MAESGAAQIVELVWNKGIAQRCDRRFPDEFADGRYLPVPNFAGALTSSKLPSDLIANAESHRNIRDGELVWVRLSWLKRFFLLRGRCHVFAPHGSFAQHVEVDANWYGRYALARH